MSNKFRQSIGFTRGFVASQQVAGDSNDTVYAGQNIVFKGSPGNVYAEAFRGIDQVTPLTKAYPFEYNLPQLSVVVTEGSDIIEVDGTMAGDPHADAGGRFGAHMPAGSMIILGRKLYLITQVLTPTKARIRPSFEGTSAHQINIGVPPMLCTMNEMLGITYGGGNAVSLPRGHILTTGSNQRVIGISNPAGLVDTPTTDARPTEIFNVPVSSKPALLNVEATPIPYTERLLGLSVPPLVPANIMAMDGGSKNMPAGRYSMRIARSSLETIGYGNPSEAVEVSINAGQKIKLTFPGAEPGQTAWRVFASLYSVAEAITGPWYELVEVPEAEIGVLPGRVREFEWRDYEIAGSQLVTFDNDLPPLARFVAMYAGMPILLSSRGKPITAGGPEVAPGPSVQPSKLYNPEGFPTGASLAMGPVQDIVSFVEGEGRLYAITNNYIHIITLTGNPDQPLTVRPFAQSSIIKHNSLVYVQGVLYGFSARGPMRISGDALGVEDRTFSAPVRDITERWEAARVFVAYDGHNEAILFIHTNDSRTAQYDNERTMVLSYSIALGVWSTPIFLEDDIPHTSPDPSSGQEGDLLITGVTTLGGRVFLMQINSRRTAGSIRMWDGGTAAQPWYMATPFIDQGAPGMQKNIRQLSVTHRGMATKASVYGLFPDQPAPAITESGFASSQIPNGLDMATAGGKITATAVEKINAMHMRLYAVKIAGLDTVAAGTNHVPDRVDEIVVAGSIHVPSV